MLEESGSYPVGVAAYMFGCDSGLLKLGSAVLRQSYGDASGKLHLGSWLTAPHETVSSRAQQRANVI